MILLHIRGTWLDNLIGIADPAARPAACNLDNYHGTGECVPFVIRTFEWGVAIATFLSVLSIVPRHCARLTDFLLSQLRKINAALITVKRITLTLTLRRLRCACSAQEAFPYVSFGASTVH